ncbi:hypothetical protein ACTMTJ_05575 [Phytohabitans sp. LJ34]|uniref:hypothetical protein n=1 Tax=Phytohabitans sp. LJ34 TaxID=3452217 RepID=UPI003F890038
MLMHPDLILAQANDRQRELIAEADRERLLAVARLARRGRRARHKAPVRGQPRVMPAR